MDKKNFKEITVTTDCGVITVEEYDDGIANGIKIFLGDTIVAMVDCYRKRELPDLPTTVEIAASAVQEDEDEDSLSISLGNILSNLYGFCVYSFNFKKQGNIYKVTDINWDTSDDDENEDIPEARLLIYRGEEPDCDEPQQVIRIN